MEVVNIEENKTKSAVEVEFNIAKMRKDKHTTKGEKAEKKEGNTQRSDIEPKADKQVTCSGVTRFTSGCSEI